METINRIAEVVERNNVVNELIELIAKNAKEAEWREVQEWFWDHERKVNPTISILVDGFGIHSLHHKHSKASPKQSLGRGTNQG